MNLRNATVLSLFAAAITLPGLSFATSEWHPSNGEAGFTYHPDHVKSTKTRAEARAELEAARKDGTLALMQRGAPLPPKATGPGKTREQVISELRNETPQERRARMHMHSGS
jgi:Domain of unknown function (DUF4148)